VDIPKKKWEVITPEDLENARPKIEKGDIVIIHSGWHEKYSDSDELPRRKQRGISRKPS